MRPLVGMPGRFEHNEQAIGKDLNQSEFHICGGSHTEAILGNSIFGFPPVGSVSQPAY